MSCPDCGYITDTPDSPEGSVLPIRALIINPVTAEPLLTSQVATIVIKVHDSDGVETHDDSPAAADVIDDVLVEDEEGWVFERGYNFRYVVPGAAFNAPNERFIVTVTITDNSASANVVVLLWKHKTINVP